MMNKGKKITGYTKDAEDEASKKWCLDNIDRAAKKRGGILHNQMA